MNKSNKYELVSKNEHEILMEELFQDNSKIYDKNASAFDYKSINDYKSIFKYRSSNAMHRSNSAINCG